MENKRERVLGYILAKGLDADDLFRIAGGDCKMATKKIVKLIAEGGKSVTPLMIFTRTDDHSLV